jgi:hypothetical protein
VTVKAWPWKVQEAEMYRPCGSVASKWFPLAEQHTTGITITAGSVHVIS